MDSVQISIMTFNIRTARADDGVNSWHHRRDLAVKVVDEADPDVFGVQEAFPEQLDDLKTGLPAYEWFGLDVAGVHERSHNALFYRTDRLERLDAGDFWLSETPDVPGSTSWGNPIVRMATWGTFRHIDSDRELTVLNAHLHHLHKSADDDTIRDRQAQRITAKCNELPDPLFVIGDFNTHGGRSAGRGSHTHHIFTGEASGLLDAWLHTRDRYGPEGTFHGFTGSGWRRVDWVLVRGEVEIDAVRHIDLRRGDVFPSDHFPVVASVRL